MTDDNLPYVRAITKTGNSRGFNFPAEWARKYLPKGARFVKCTPHPDGSITIKHHPTGLPSDPFVPSTHQHDPSR